MANRKAPIAAAILCLCFVRAQCDHSPEQEQEIQMLKSKVASLEDEVSRRKEENSQLECVVRERTAQMATLVGELELLQKVNVADDESVIKANTNIDMLQEQIERLGNDLEDQVRKGESLEARATEAEKNCHEFRRKLEHAENNILEQRKKNRDLNDKLKNAQDKISELEKETKLKAAELAMVHTMWLPRWLGVRVVRWQEVASAKWQVHGKPVFDPLMQKVTDKWTYAQRLVEPRLQTAHNEWRTFSQPYISQIFAASEPHLSRASVALEPYMKPVTSGWRRFVSLTSEYHHQVQNGVECFLEKNRLVTPVPADKLAWFTASALFALPVLSICKVLSATIRVLLCSKKVQARKDGGSNRKNKRRVDK